MNASKLPLAELKVIQNKLSGRITEMEDLIYQFKGQRVKIPFNITYEELLILKEKYKDLPSLKTILQEFLVYGIDEEQVLYEFHTYEDIVEELNRLKNLPRWVLIHKDETPFNKTLIYHNREYIMKVMYIMGELASVGIGVQKKKYTPIGTCSNSSLNIDYLLKLDPYDKSFKKQLSKLNFELD